MENGQTEYLGNARDGLGGVGETYASAPPSFQLTVYARDYAPPAFLREGVMYQIFPDRFCRSRAPRYTREDIYLHENWDEAPLALFDPRNGDTHSRDFFGGDLQGIISKLDYLQSLHVTVLYLNPIFLARSNHRYDTGDYTRIDPMLGTQADLTRLCEEAAKRGMRVLLDGVFNHTGDDSLYFNRYGRYDSVGAYQSPDSPYAGWFTFERFPDKYKCWWGVDTLPEVNKDNEDYRRFILAEDGVARRWMRAGTAGWRLDVADELPDWFLEKIRSAMEETKPDSILIGEVWEDGSNKIAYSQRRRYLLGSETHGLMNYPFRTALLAYLRGGDADDFREAMETLRENYPKAAFYSAMNFLGTHDTPRILTLLGAREIPGDKAERAAYRLLPWERAEGIARLRLAALVLFTFPGSPMVYYGDEAGMEGFEDPLNRGTYPWGQEDTELLAWFSRLGTLRNAYPALQSGTLSWLYTAGPLLIFAREADSERLVTAVNASGDPHTVTLSWGPSSPQDLLSGESLAASDGVLRLELPPWGGRLLR